MKLYDFTLAPNAKRVRVFMAEKGVSVPAVQVQIRDREQFTDAYRRINPLSVVPALELDDGTVITESIAICRYFEEVQPAPPLFGTGAVERAQIEMWNRRAELFGFMPAGEAVRNSVPLFADRGLAGVPGGVPQIPALVSRGKNAMLRFLRILDPHLADNEFLAGKQFSVADITGHIAISFAGRAEITIPDDCPNVARWYGTVGARPSAEA